MIMIEKGANLLFYQSESFHIGSEEKHLYFVGNANKII